MTADESQARIDFSQAHVVSERLKVLSNSDRLKILCVLVDSEMNVQQIELQTDIHQPTLSQQLTVLRKAEMVSTRREGKQIFYQLSDPKVLTLMQTLYQLYCKA
ncbi:ArsR/SmtB family transcription factor [Acinetobacter variabilis]|uniref:ArsR/SmtB family transcription factor n=1 Tax=Acinetobacter variabilis TaxID=70346 RepID=UPI001BB63681|nr:metalloregulator ArsR/SmtB family transcription factor [Acinetobacter variabilis]BCT89209.1 transcriptional regulator [Acinetobacter variabilis]